VVRAREGCCVFFYATNATEDGFDAVECVAGGDRVDDEEAFAVAKGGSAEHLRG
jgi:hypothetical protein